MGKDVFLGYPSITPTVLQAPVKGEPQLNVIPYQCRALLDIRTVPGQSHEALKKQLEDIVKEEERSVNASLDSGPLKEIRETLEKGLSKGISFQSKLNVFEDRPWTRTSREETDCPGCFEGDSIHHRRGTDLRGCPGCDGWYFSLCVGRNSHCDDRCGEVDDPPSKGRMGFG